MPSSQSKYWCFTINNPTEEDSAPLHSDIYEYLVVGNEVGEEGTPHLQGFIVMKKRTRLPSMKTILPRAHLEVMKGQPSEAAAYCKKDGDYIEEGTLPADKGHSGGAATRERYAKAIALAYTGIVLPLIVVYW